MESIKPPAWGPPVAYLYTLKLDDLSLAWEYLRRNRQYRSEFVCVIRNQERNILPSSWGLAYWEDPREDARSVEPEWLSAPNSQIILAGAPAGSDAPFFDFWKIPGRKTLSHDGKYLNVTARRGSEVLHRARWRENLTQGDPLGVMVPGGRGFTVRARAAQRFLGSLDLEARQALPELPERPSINAITHMQILQALDGEAAGASQRQIARRLFGLSTDSNWDADSPCRARVRYLIQCGRTRSTHGFRRMAGLGGDVPGAGAHGATVSPRIHARAKSPRIVGRTQRRPLVTDAAIERTVA